VRTVLGGAMGRDLIPVLGATGRLELAFSLLLLVGLML
jgi:1,4-dihydroxy-2-naphthoate octaprenyltransferase